MTFFLLCVLLLLLTSRCVVFCCVKVKCITHFLRTYDEAVVIIIIFFFYFLLLCRYIYDKAKKSSSRRGGGGLVVINAFCELSSTAHIYFFLVSKVEWVWVVFWRLWICSDFRRLDKNCLFGSWAGKKIVQWSDELKAVFLIITMHLCKKKCYCVAGGYENARTNKKTCIRICVL